MDKPHNTQAQNDQNESTSTVRNIAQSVTIVPIMLGVVSALGPAVLEKLFKEKSNDDKAFLERSKYNFANLISKFLRSLSKVGDRHKDLCIYNIPHLFHPKAHRYRTDRYNNAESPEMPEHSEGAYDWLKTTPRVKARPTRHRSRQDYKGICPHGMDGKPRKRLSTAHGTIELNNEQAIQP